MATIKAKKDMYGQIELNRCSFLHDGNIEGQCAATTDLENGAIVLVDKANNAVTAATEEDFAKAGLAVNYTAERIYDERTSGRKNFKVKKGEYPRVGFLKTGDLFTTNVMLTDGTSLDDTQVATGLYWTAPTKVSTTAVVDAKLTLKVVEITDTADGQTALKIQVV